MKTEFPDTLARRAQRRRASPRAWAAGPRREAAAGLAAAAVVLALLASGGCARRTVSRVETDTTIDLSGRWNDVDSRQTAEALVQDVLNATWVGEWMQSHQGSRPVVIVGTVRNRTSEHIPVGTFVADIERALVNSGRVDVVATAAERGELRGEREDQWQNATEETAKQMGRELGADFLLSGGVESIVDREGGEKVLFYQVDLGLLEIESNRKAWLGQHRIKKVVSQGRYAP
jgi:uncharacterized protein (TIGR02722 family)